MKLKKRHVLTPLALVALATITSNLKRLPMDGRMEISWCGPTPAGYVGYLPPLPHLARIFERDLTGTKPSYSLTVELHEAVQQDCLSPNGAIDRMLEKYQFGDFKAENYSPRKSQSTTYSGPSSGSSRQTKRA